MLVVISYDDNVVNEGAFLSEVDAGAEDFHKTPDLELPFSATILCFFSECERAFEFVKDFFTIWIQFDPCVLVGIYPDHCLFTSCWHDLFVEIFKLNSSFESIFSSGAVECAKCFVLGEISVFVTGEFICQPLGDKFLNFYGIESQSVRTGTALRKAGNCCKEVGHLANAPVRMHMNSYQFFSRYD